MTKSQHLLLYFRAIIYAFCFLSSLEDSHMFFSLLSDLMAKTFTSYRRRMNALKIPKNERMNVLKVPGHWMYAKYRDDFCLFALNTRINICTVLICFNRLFFIISGFYSKILCSRTNGTKHECAEEKNPDWWMAQKMGKENGKKRICKRMGNRQEQGCFDVFKDEWEMHLTMYLAFLCIHQEDNNFSAIHSTEKCKRLSRLSYNKCWYT